MIRASLSQIVSSMRHRRSAYASLVLEVALGCTVVAYVLALDAGLRAVATATIGIDEERTFTVAFEAPPRGSHEDRRAAELAALRALPGVVAASWVELPPLSRRELPEAAVTPQGDRLVWTLRADENVLAALGVEVAAGRAFTARDVQAEGPKPVVVTRPLAEHFPGGALGKIFVLRGYGRLQIVGVLDEPLRVGPFYRRDSELVIMPSQPLAARRTTYLLRTTRAAAGGFADSAPAALLGGGQHGWISVARLADTREFYVRNVEGAATIILITVFGMVAVVLVGSLGMASSLVVERARQIGIRRALGARKSDITAYFMLENLLATALGLLIGAGLCAGLDQLLAPVKGELVIDWPAYLEIAGAIFLITGQLAVFMPARRAARIAPSIASRAA